MVIKVNKKLTKNAKLRLTEFFIGMGLGTGYLTSLRFSSFVGVSEIFFLFALVVLSQLYIKKIFAFTNTAESAVRLYLLTCFLFIAPIVTLITMLTTDYNSLPSYLIAYILEVFLLFLLVYAIDDNLSMRFVTIWFLAIFLITNFISLYILDLSIGTERYTGGANNPNQLLFYSSSLTLLLVIYTKRIFLLSFPFVTFVMIKTGSDAYILSIIIVPLVYILFKIFSFKKFSYGLNIFLQLILALILVIMILSFFLSDLIQLWLAADEGNLRLSLMLNALKASMSSPLFGWGAGTFSGTMQPFEGWEAHNTFLDFFVQFGIFVPVIFYFLMIAFLIKKYIQREFFIAAFVLSYIISGLFHFSGRHFVFWIEIAIFYYSFFMPAKD